jgi:hypothetical protein
MPLSLNIAALRLYCNAYNTDFNNCLKGEMRGRNKDMKGMKERKIEVTV